MEGEARSTFIDAVAEMSMALDEDLADAHLVKTVCVVEFVFPGGRRTLHAIGLNNDGSQIQSWEAAGMLTKILARNLG